MLVKQRLVEGDGFAVVDVRCGVPRAGWSAPETDARYGVVFVRSGCFRRVSDGVESVLDPTSLYFEAPGRERRTLHPHDGGDRCTVIELEPELVEPLISRPLPPGALFSPPFLDLEHRRLLALAHRSADRIDREQIVALVGGALARIGSPHAAVARSEATAARRRIVDSVRELLATDLRAALVDLARTVFVSPHHLSRVFAAETGQTISDYRNCLRVRNALERIADGEPSLARVAADLGFADHAHMTRVVRQAAGAPPLTLRELLRFGA